VVAKARRRAVSLAQVLDLRRPRIPDATEIAEAEEQRRLKQKRGKRLERRQPTTWEQMSPEEILAEVDAIEATRRAEEQAAATAREPVPLWDAVAWRPSGKTAPKRKRKASVPLGSVRLRSLMQLYGAEPNASNSIFPPRRGLSGTVTASLDLAAYAKVKRLLSPFPAPQSAAAQELRHRFEGCLYAIELAGRPDVSTASCAQQTAQGSPARPSGELGATADHAAQQYVADVAAWLPSLGEEQDSPEDTTDTNARLRQCGVTAQVERAHERSSAQSSSRTERAHMALSTAFGSAEAAQRVLRKAPNLIFYKAERLLLHYATLAEIFDEPSAVVLEAPYLLTVPPASVRKVLATLHQLLGPDLGHRVMARIPRLLMCRSERIEEAYATLADQVRSGQCLPTLPCRSVRGICRPVMCHHIRSSVCCIRLTGNAAAKVQACVHRIELFLSYVPTGKHHS
jgi:hypothetical protein